MNITDLSIGNLVEVGIEQNLRSVIGIVDFISSDGLVRVKYGQVILNYVVNNLNGLEVDEEWLLKFGFTVNNEISFRKDNLLIYLGQFGKNIIYFTNDSEDDKEIGDTNYIHELQNFYFAFKGKELYLRTK